MQKSEQISASAVARLFSSSVLKELARKGRSPLFSRLAHEANFHSDDSPVEVVGEFFDSAFSYLKMRRNRHEYIYKSAITQKVLLGIHSLRTASMITEFRVGACKADVAIFNGTGTVYEIKSERDTLSRLERQVSSYRDVFASVNVIVGENHLDGVIDAVPYDVGVMLLSDRYQLKTIRHGKNLPERTSPSAIFESITLREAEIILKDVGLVVPEVPNTQRYIRYHEQFCKILPAIAHECMVKTLKKTRNLASLESLLDCVPPSLHSAVLSSRLNKDEKRKLITALQTPISDALEWT